MKKCTPNSEGILRSIKNKFVFDLQQEGIDTNNPLFNLKESDYSIEDYSNFIKEESLPITLDDLYSYFDFMQHENIIGNRETALRIWAMNNDQPLWDTQLGQTSELFFELLQLNNNDFVKAYRDKAKLYSYKVNSTLYDWLNLENKEKLKEKGLLNRQGEPVISQQLGQNGFNGKRFVFMEITRDTKFKLFEMSVDNINTGKTFRYDSTPLRNVDLYNTFLFGGDRLTNKEMAQVKSYLRSIKNKFVFDLQQEGIDTNNPLFNLKESDYSIEDYTNFIKEESLPITLDDLYSYFDFMQHENIIGNRETALRIWAMNNDQPLWDTQLGQTSELFFELLQLNNNDFVKAYRDKAKLYSYKVNSTLYDWLNLENKEKLKDKGLLNRQGEPVISQQLGQNGFNGKRFVFMEITEDTEFKLFEMSVKNINTGKTFRYDSTPLRNVDLYNTFLFGGGRLTNKEMAQVKSYFKSSFLGIVNETDVDISNDHEFYKDRIKSSLLNELSNQKELYDKEISNEFQNTNNITTIGLNIKKLNYLLNNFDRIFNNTNKSLKHYYTDQKKLKDAGYDVDQSSINPITRAGTPVKLLMEGIKKSAKDSNSIDIFYETYNRTTIDKKLRMLLSGTRNSFTTIMEKLEAYSKDNESEYWIKEFIARLKKAPSDVKNMFVSNISTIVLDQLEVNETSNGYFTNNIHEKTMYINKLWYNDFINSNIFEKDPGNNGYKFNRDNARRVVNIFFNYELKLANNKITNTEIKEIFNNVGIQISDNLVQKIKDKSIKLKIGNRKVKYTPDFMTLNYHTIGNIYSGLRGYLNSETTRLTNDDMIRMFDMPTFRALAKEESSVSEMYENGVVNVDEKAYPFQSQSLWIEQEYLLKDDTDHFTKLTQSYWSKDSMLLNGSTKPYESLKVIEVASGVMKKSGSKYNKNDKLPSLSNKEMTIAKLQLFLSNNYQPYYDGTNIYINTLFKTPSDSSNIFALHHPAVQIPFLFDESDISVQRVGSITQTVQRISEKAINALYMSMVNPEAERIIMHANGTRSSNAAWNDHGDKFIAVPSMNHLIIKIKDGNGEVYERSYLDILRKDSREKIDEYQSSIKEAVFAELRIMIQKEMDYMLDNWENAGVYNRSDKVKENTNKYQEALLTKNLGAFRKKFTEELKKIGITTFHEEEQLQQGYREFFMKMFSAYYVYNNMFATANMEQLFGVDPVHFAVNGSKPDGTKSIDFFDTSMATSKNILKRSRMFTTPRQKLDEDKLPKGFEVIMIEEPRISAYTHFFSELGINDYAYNSVKYMDGHGYVTVKTQLYLLFLDGSITEQQYKENLEYYKEQKTLKESIRIGFSKPVYTGMIWDDKTNSFVPHYIKYGQSPLIPAMYDGIPVMKALREKMEALEEADEDRHILLIPPTSNKTFRPALELPKLSESMNLNPIVLGNNESDYEQVKISLPSFGYGIKEKSHLIDLLDNQSVITLSKQLKNFIMTNMLDKKRFVYQKESVDGKFLFNKYNETLNSLYVFHKKEFYQSIGLPANGVLKTEEEQVNFVKRLRQELIKYIDEGSSNVIDVDRFDIDYNNEKFVDELLLSRNEPLLERILMSMIDHRAHSFELPGNSFYVVPFAGEWTNPGEGIETAQTGIVWTEEKAVQRLDPPTLDKPNVNVIISSKISDNKGRLLDLFEKENGKYKWIKKTANGFVLNKEVFEDTSIFNTIGYRIPSPNHSYYLNINIVGFTPDYINTIMVHPSVVAKTGHDNDADKFYLHIKHHTIKDGKVVVDDSDIKKKYENDILDVYKAVLSNPDREVQRIIWESVDSNKTELQAKVYEAIKSEDVKYIFGESYQTKLMKDNNATKRGTETFASITHLISQIYYLNELHGISFPVYENIYYSEEDRREQKIISFNIFGQTYDGNIIKNTYANTTPPLQETGYHLSTSVDNSAKQYMAALNRNNQTFITIVAMILMGMYNDVQIMLDDNKSFIDSPINLLLNQPVIIDYLERLSNKASFNSINNITKENVLTEMFGKETLELMVNNSSGIESNFDFSLVNFDLSLAMSNALLSQISPQDAFETIVKGEYENNTINLAYIVLFETLNNLGQKFFQANRFMGYDRSGYKGTILENYSMVNAYTRALAYDTMPNVRNLIEINGKPFFNAGAGYFMFKEITENLFDMNMHRVPIKTVVSTKFYQEALVEYVTKSNSKHEKLEQLIPSYEDISFDVQKYFWLKQVHILGMDISGDSGIYQLSNLDMLRKNMYISTKNNNSLAKYIKKLMNSDQSLIDNIFFNSLIFDLDNPKGDSIKFDYHLMDPGMLADIKIAVEEFINEDRLLNLNLNGEDLMFNNEVLTGSKLFKYIYLYSILGGDMNMRSNFKNLIPADIRKSTVNTDEALEMISDNYRGKYIGLEREMDPLNLAMQIIQHNPNKAEKVYWKNQYESVQKDFTFKDKGGEIITDLELAYYLYPNITNRYYGNTLSIQRLYQDGSEKFLLFVNEGGRYARIDVLGNECFTEYNPYVNFMNIKSILNNP